MNLTSLIETFGDHSVLAMGGAFIGLIFGFFAQRSKFCARAAVIECCDGTWGSRLAVWLMGFAVAILAVQAIVLVGFLKPESSRHLGSPGSISGAVVGGLIVGLTESFGGLFLGESLGQIGISVIFILILLFRPSGLFGAKS